MKILIRTDCTIYLGDESNLSPNSRRRLISQRGRTYYLVEYGCLTRGQKSSLTFTIWSQNKKTQLLSLLFIALIVACSWQEDEKFYDAHPTQHHPPAPMNSQDKNVGPIQ